MCDHDQFYYSRVPNRCNYVDRNVYSKYKEQGPLSEDIFNSIFRQLSERPNHPEWKRFVNMNDAIRLFRDHDVLSAAASREFQRVSDVSFPGNHLVYTYLGRRTAIKEILRMSKVAAHAISHITFDDDLIDEMTQDEQSAIIRRFANLDSVDFLLAGYAGERIFFENFMQAKAGTLTFVEIQTSRLQPSVVSTLAKYGTGISELRFLPGGPYCSTAPMWPTLGKSLHALTVQVKCNDPRDTLASLQETLFHITASCRVLSKLSLLIPGNDFDEEIAAAVLQCCQGFGDQLRYLKVTRHFPRYVWLSIVDSCPSIEIEAPVHIDILLNHDWSLPVGVDNFTALHFNIQDLDLRKELSKEEHTRHTWIREILQTDFPTALQSCSETTAITMHLPASIAAVLMQIIFATSGANLQTLEVTSLYDTPADVSALATAISNARGLRHLSLAIRWAENNSFEELAYACPSLTSVKVQLLDYEEDEDEAFYASIINDFSKCPNIKSIIIDGDGYSNVNLRMIRNAYRRLRARGVYVEVPQRVYAGVPGDIKDCSTLSQMLDRLARFNPNTENPPRRITLTSAEQVPDRMFT